MRQLLEKAQTPGTGLGSMGVAVIEALFHGDPEQKIRYQVHVGFWGLWSKGYFSVLKAGGPEVASYLGHWGLNSQSRIKDMLQRVRG
jgi:hypothetical protein